MAKNRELEPEPEHEESVGTEEEEESSEEGSEDESPLPKSGSQIFTSQKLTHPPSSSEDDDEEEESDSDSDTPVQKPDLNAKPIASKSMTEDPLKPSAASSARKPRSKPGTAGPTSSPKPGVKRPAEKETEVKDTKKSKKKADSEGENSEKKGASSVVLNDDPKKQLFQRLWSEEDEIVILNGMLDYASKKKADPISDIGAFLEFIKKSLHVEVSKTQLQDKVRRLKKKFENNASKEKNKNGKERTFSKPHEQTAYDLSKKIWGKSFYNNGNVVSEKVPETPKSSGSVVRKSRSTNVVPSTPKFNDIDDKEMKDVDLEGTVAVLKNGSVGGGLGYSSVTEWILKDGVKLVQGEKREEMEEKWRKIQEQELELFLKRSELMCQQTKLVLEAMRKSDH